LGLGDEATSLRWESARGEGSLAQPVKNAQNRTASAAGRLRLLVPAVPSSRVRPWEARIRPHANCDGAIGNIRLRQISIQKIVRGKLTELLKRSAKNQRKKSMNFLPVFGRSKTLSCGPPKIAPARPASSGRNNGEAIHVPAIA
jgi:hypothetical protein